MRRITAKEAARNLGRLLDEVERHREHVLIERRGRVVARIAPVTSGTGTP